jgi:PDZ domain-containing secreted protein
MQVRLQKNVSDTDFFLGYGFDICEKSQESGIFVCHIQPNSAAEPFLKLNDKILDIDGNDLTKLTINEAKDILLEQHKQQQLVFAATSGIISTNTEITLNIMLSRI